jgi:hypothetical protein
MQFGLSTHRLRPLRMPVSSRPLLLPVVALVAGWLVMTWPWLLGRVTIPWDAKAHFHPQIQFMAQSIARGEWPWWTPHVFAGHPQIADPQSMLFSPPFVLLALLNGNPSLWAVDVTVLLMQLAGAIALMAWMRDQNWHWAGAIIGGLVFAFGASMAWRLQHTGQVLSLAYWPMAMLAIDRAIRLGSYRWGLVAGVVGAAIVLGRDQVALLVVYLLIAYAVWRWLASDQPRQTVQDSIGPLAAGAVVTMMLVAIPILLTTLLAAESNRPSIDFIGAGRGSMHPALFLTFLMPQVFGAAYRMEDYWGPPSFAWSNTGLFIAQNMGQVYVGAVPILLMVIAACRGDFIAREVRFFTIAFLVAVLYALGWFTPVFRVFYEILPGVKFYRRPADATFLIGALSAVLTGYAVHRLFSKPWDRLNETAIAATAVLVGLAFAASLGLGLWLDRVGTLGVPLAIAALSLVVAAAVIAFVKPRIALEPALMAAVLAAVVAVDLGYNNGPSTSSALPPATYEAMQPRTRNATVAAIASRLTEARAEDASGARRDRMEFMGVGFHWPNVSLSHGLENTLGYNPVRLGLYSRATGAQDHIGLPDQRKFSALLPSYKSTLVDMLGLRFIAAGQPLEWHDKGLKTGDFKLVAKTDEAWIYENPRALPRVMMTARADGVDFDSVLQSGRWPADFDAKRTVLLNGTTRVAFVSFGASSAVPLTAKLVRYTNTDIVVEAVSPHGGWLVLNDPWHPWWFAEVDGKPAPILRANVIFRAVELAAGTHTVRFRFRPLLGAWTQLRSPTSQITRPTP